MKIRLYFAKAGFQGQQSLSKLTQGNWSLRHTKRVTIKGDRKSNGEGRVVGETEEKSGGGTPIKK